ncbi:8-oxo-dGTP pyrophosphatase MutT (NUDIX family) [Mumia flava]|uniref:8-oxo-dGTP pyrophosphatase MutT (NUDIX family) n=1 Tax=Mumia flava TaxID=1348852 RepID=A0A0B2AVX5_9ACTN|nr:NUDIX domain-containing protein [Mumia flava]PJJ56635.1 8-oxo-dGTP pyrophosphatase MutT (NUDIX family) [Mumia flava]
MSLHADARALLARWSAPDGVQDALRARYVEHLDAHPDAMQRACHPDHLTASALVVSADASRVLLTLHRRLRRWLQTGGHCEPGDETLAAAALREATEESGIDGLRLDPEPVLLSLHEVPCGPVRPSHHLDVQFVAVAPASATPVISEESIDVAWFDAEALPETDASVRALVAAARARTALIR